MVDAKGLPGVAMGHLQLPVAAAHANVLAVFSFLWSVYGARQRELYFFTSYSEKVTFPQNASLTCLACEIGRPRPSALLHRLFVDFRCGVNVSRCVNA